MEAIKDINTENINYENLQKFKILLKIKIIKVKKRRKLKSKKYQFNQNELFLCIHFNLNKRENSTKERMKRVSSVKFLSQFLEKKEYQQDYSTSDI